MEVQPPEGLKESIVAADRDLETAKTRYEELQKEVQTAIKVVKEIAAEIQKQEDIGRVGDIVYAGTGLFSGGLFITGIALAPFTAGLSLVATAGSAALGVGSAVAGVTHGIVKEKLVNNSLEEATKLLDSVRKNWENLHTLLESVVQRLNKLNPSVLESIMNPGKIRDAGKVGKGVILGVTFYRASKALNLIRKGKFERLQSFLLIGKHVNSALTKVGSKVGVNLVKTAKGVTSVANKVMIPLTIFGAVMDVKDIVENSVKISKGEMNEKAKALIESADQLEEEMKKLAEIFEEV